MLADLNDTLDEKTVSRLEIHDTEYLNELYDDKDMESPLMGMADSVLSDIMSSQVSQASLCVLFRSGIPLTYPELNQ